MDNTLNQAFEAMTFLYGGFCAGILCGLFAAFRRHAHKRAALAALDVLLALCLLFLTAASFMLANGGEPRLFGALLLLAGGLVSAWAFHPLFSVL